MVKKLGINQVERESYSYSSLANIKEWSDIPANTSLFESILVFENYPMDQSLLERTGDFVISEFNGESETTNYPLTIAALPDREFQIDVRYNPNYFKAQTISQMISNFQLILTEMITHPNQILSDIQTIVLHNQVEQTEQQKQALLKNAQQKLQSRRRKSQEIN